MLPASVACHMRQHVPRGIGRSCSSCCEWRSGSASCWSCCRAAAHSRRAGSRVGAGDAMSAASATVHDLRHSARASRRLARSARRSPTTIGYKAQAGAKMLYEFLTEQLAPNAGRARRRAGKLRRHGRADKARCQRRIALAEHADASRPRAGVARAGARARRQLRPSTRPWSPNLRPSSATSVDRAPRRSYISARDAGRRTQWPDIDEIIDNFSRPRRLGRPLPLCHRAWAGARAACRAARTDANKVQGCASQVWLVPRCGRTAQAARC